MAADRGTRRNAARLFFALVPDPRTRRRILARRRELGLSGRPVPASRLHATLAFLGDQPRERISEFCDVASSLPFSPIVLQLDRLGFFVRAGIAWLGTRHVPDELAELRANLVDRLVRRDVTVDQKPWILHITLYRDLRTRSRSMDVEPLRWTVSGFVLMESVTRPEGLEYRARGRWPPRPVPADRDVR